MQEIEACISINHVSKSFGKQQVLEDINLKIFEGEIFGLLGPSGAGKTTLSKTIDRLRYPDIRRNLFISKENAYFKFD